MIKMHNDEIEINEKLVSLLIKEQCPQWADLLLISIKSSGTDNALFRLGNEYVVRLPRIEPNENISKEYEWIPKIARLLKTPISVPLFKGTPTKFYPWSWIIAKWNDGHNPIFEKENEYELLAKDLAYFLNDLHQIKLIDGPFSRRGGALKELNTETTKAISELKNEIDARSITALWNQLSSVPTWNQEPVWVHGDFLPGNILIQNNRLSAVIDFSEVGVGDPACDLIIAWSLFRSQSREIFRENLKHIDDNTWERGRGWALSIALIILPYYKHSNPALVAVANQMIENVMLA